MRCFHVFAMTVLLVFLTSVCWAAQFPYRDQYPEVPTIELQELKKGYDQGEIVILDVRSEMEYDVIHPKNSKHISLAKEGFLTKIQQLAKEHPNKRIACYCNGITCLKSYEAVKKAKEAGISDVYAFDAGIFEWAKAYPKDTLLLGKEIENPKRQLIPEKVFQKQCVSFATFIKKASDEDSVVVDVRSPIQRTQSLPGLKDVKVIEKSCDNFISDVVKKERMKDKTLLIFDQVGKQVKWLMYYMADNRYTDYYFLRGGAAGVLNEQEYR